MALLIIEICAVGPQQYPDIEKIKNIEVIENIFLFIYATILIELQLLSVMLLDYLKEFVQFVPLKLQSLL